MLQGIDINQVKQYNASLKQYRDKAANINAQIEFNKKELNKLCAELTAELGVEVTESNVEQIYQEQVEKINNTLKSGNTVLAKIAEEEQKLVSGVNAQGPVTNEPIVPPQQPIQQDIPQAPQIPQTPQGVGQTAPTAQLFESNATPGSIFGNGQAIGGQGMFKLG